MSRPSHCEWCPFPGCDSCAYKGHDPSTPLAGWVSGRA